MSTIKNDETVELKTLELTGRVLDWAVGQALHMVVSDQLPELKSLLDGAEISAEAVKNFSPTQDKTLAQKLIKQEGVRIEYYESSPRSGWEDYTAVKGDAHYIGQTAEIAGLRCIVGAKLGNRVRVPRELIEVTHNQPVNMGDAMTPA